MSENDRIDLFNSLKKGLAKATRKMLERKAMLGEKVVIADETGQPVTISAKEALKLLDTQK